MALLHGSALHSLSVETLRQRGGLRAVLHVAAYLALYVLLDSLSYVRPVQNLGITAWNPESGLTLAFLLTSGPRYAIFSAAGVLICEIFVHHNPAGLPLLLGSSLWIAAGYAVLTSLLRRASMPVLIETSGNAARFALAALLVTLVVAAGYVAMYALAGWLPKESIDEHVMRYWVGDLNGVLTITPLLLSMARWRAAPRAILEQRWLVLAQFGTMLLTLALIIRLFATHQLRSFYFIFLPIIWVALRWGVPGAMLSALVIQVGLIIGLERAQWPLLLIDVQFLMLTVNATALLLGAAITDRAQALRHVAAGEAEQRALLATAPDAVLAVDTRHKILSANPAAHRLFGHTVDADPGAKLEQLLPGLTLDEAEGRAMVDGQHANGHTFTAEIAWARLEAPANEGFLVIVRDATERLQAEAQLRERDTALARAMRFAVAGELASALTHELNQPITALVSYLRASEILAAPLAAGDERLQTTLGKAAREAMRASQVLLRLRDFYQGGGAKPEPIDAVVICQTVVNAFQDRLRRTQIDLTFNLPATLPVEADSTQLEIVLHNLLANAIDAIVHDTAAMRQIALTGEATETEVRLSITDSGPGLARDVRQKLFEPFVTSKTDGMGLGLAISKSLLRAQGGELIYEPGGVLGGACFSIHLPRYAAQQSSGARAQSG